MALTTDGPPGLPAISVHGALDTIGSGLQALATALAERLIALREAATVFLDGMLQHKALMTTGVVAGAATVVLVLLVTKVVRHSIGNGTPRRPRAPPSPAAETKDDLQTLPLPELEKILASSPNGLSASESAKRLTQYGPNEIEEKRTNVLLKILSYFWGPIPWMIEVAVILSGVVRHWPDFSIILVLLVANAAVGFFEERQAGNAIEALKAKLAIKARVRRDGTWITPPARELVPGDAIRLRLGDIVPADARLLDGDEVSVDQSALTPASLLPIL